MKRNVDGSHSLKAKHALEQEGPAHAAKETPDAAGKAKGVLSVNSKLFLLQTRNDQKKKLKITQMRCV